MRSLRFLGVLAFAVAGSFCDNSPLPVNAEKGPYDKIAITSHMNITGLKGPVDVVRDKYGMIHIHATTTEDAVRVEGYQVARDRTAQLEIIRRAATGRLAELLGDAAPNLIDSDIAMRTVGLHRTAKLMLDAAPPDVKSWIEAYADGISQFNARVVTGDEALPPGMIGLGQQAFVPFTANDVVAIARFQAFNLGYDADGEIALTDFVEAARDAFKATATDPAIAKRAGILLDTVKFAPLTNATPLPGFPNDPGENASLRPGTIAKKSPKVTPYRASREAVIATRAWRDAVAAVHKLAGDKKMGTTGSNDWIVGPSRSANGHALLANDPHLSLSAPSVFWMVQVTVDGTTPADQSNFAGLSFPGIPGIILGFNHDVAWGATTADYDVTDVYEETLTSDNASVMFNGAPVALQKIHETIQIASHAPLEYDVLVVPHHGPIVPTITAQHTITPPSGKALSVRWVGHQATNDLSSVFNLIKSKNVEDARKALKDFGVGAQNWVVADNTGNILYDAHALIPKRARAAFTWDPKTFTGKIPCMVLPGDGSAEWTGQFLEEAFIPHVKNPQKGYLGTANTEQVGTTLDNDPTNDVLPSGEPMYMACWHDVGFRLERIQNRIENVGHPMTLDDMASIQSDARSALGGKLTPQILTALQHAAEEQATPGTHADLTALVTSDRWKNAGIADLKDLLTKWGTDSDFDAASGMNPDDNTPGTDPKETAASRATSVFNTWLTQMIHLTFDDELATIGSSVTLDNKHALLSLMLADKTTLATYDATMGDSILFDDSRTVPIETRDERIVHSLLDAVDFLRAKLGNDTQQWQWGRLHTIRFEALVALWKSLSIPQDPDPIFPNGFPRHGDGFNIDVGEYPNGGLLDVATTSFAYAHGPTQRLVIEMDPNGPIARNALPGGNVWDSQDNHFRDEAERWRRNQNRPVPFAFPDVVEAAESRVVYESTP